MKKRVIIALSLLSLTTFFSLSTCYKKDSEECCNLRTVCTTAGCFTCTALVAKKVAAVIDHKNIYYDSWGNSCLETWFPHSRNSCYGAHPITTTTNSWIESSCCIFTSLLTLSSCCATEPCYRNARSKLYCYHIRGKGDVSMDYNPVNDTENNNEN